MNILSIQSHVAYGHVGNASAVFSLQRLGFEVWPVNTVQFSNHTGYGQWTGQVFTSEHIRDVVEGIHERGALKRCDAVLSGYMGDATIGQAILDTVERVRAEKPDAQYCCDPVIGDFGRGIFVRPGIPEFMRDHAIPRADIVTPNHFELEYLTGDTVRSLPDAIKAAADLRAKGPKIVVVTSLQREDAPANTIEIMVSTKDGVWLAGTPLLPLDPAPNGAGDALAALFLGHLLNGRTPAESLSLTVSGLYGILSRTLAEGERELQLILAQGEIVAPSTLFTAEKVA